MLTAHNLHLLEKFSTNFIEKNSIVIRAWLFSKLISPPTRQAWDLSLLNFIRVDSHDKRFKISASKRAALHGKYRRALPTFLPDQYLSGDAIRLSLYALQYKSPRDQYVFDIKYQTYHTITQTEQTVYGKL